MSYIYLQEREEESSAESFADIPQSVLSKLNLIAERSYSNGSEMASCQDSQSGTMSAHSMGNPGAGKLTSSAAGSLAKICHLNPQCITECRGWTGLEVDSGWSLHGSLVKYDQVLSLWKTHQISLFEDLTESLETWPKWGIMQDGECWAQTPLDLTTREIDSGWSQKDVGNQSNTQTNAKNASFAEKPGATDAESIMQNANTSGQQRMIFNTQKSKVSPKELKPTVLATDYKGGTTAIRKDRGDLRTDQWRDYVKINYGLTYPHPTHSEVRMGWPTEWSALKPLEMGKFQQWLDLHGVS